MENKCLLITAYSFFHFSSRLWILPDFIQFCSEKKAAKIRVYFDSTQEDLQLQLDDALGLSMLCCLWNLILKTSKGLLVTRKAFPEPES